MKLLQLMALILALMVLTALMLSRTPPAGCLRIAGAFDLAGDCSRHRHNSTPPLPTNTR